MLEDNGVVNLRDPSEFNFLWVDDFPLFEPPEDDSIDSSGALESTHHVFTAPKPGDEHFLYTDPTKVRGQHFDLVLNGIELGGGSVRNHQPDVQQYIIEDVLQKDIGHFSHLIEALGYARDNHLPDIFCFLGGSGGGLGVNSRVLMRCTHSALFRVGGTFSLTMYADMLTCTILMTHRIPKGTVRHRTAALHLGLIVS